MIILWRLLAAVLVSTVCGLQAFASINRAAIAISAPSKIFFGEDGQALSPELIADFHAIRSTEPKMDASKIIPATYYYGDKEKTVLMKIADKSIATWFNSAEVRDTSFGRGVTQVEKELKQEVVIESESKVQHKFNFNVQALQSVAQVQYDGYGHAAVRYIVAQHQLETQISGYVVGNKQLILSRTDRPGYNSSQAILRWTY